jgi:hypothetical protein
VKPTQFSMKPLADHRAVTHDNRSHQRVRTNPPAPKLSKLQSPLQMSLIRGRKLGIHG